MELNDQHTEQPQFSGRDKWRNRWQHRQPHTRTGRVLSGLVVIAVGAVLLARQLGVELPVWLFTWETLLIAIGFYIGAKHEFRHGGWFAPVVIGGIFLIDDIYPDITLGPIFWPVLIIGIGLIIILSPRKKHHNYWKQCNDWKDWDQHGQVPPSGEDVLNSVSIFGGVKKNIISKNFKGGEITCVFGGAEINLSQSDINGRVSLELTQVLGGTKLIVPPHWTIQSEMVTVLGGIEDKRPLHKDVTNDPEKVLVIHGTTVLGGLDIRSY